MKTLAAADIVIFGGGIAGLWLLNRLRATGLSAILFESNALGGGQTCKAQGIIHGGMKYALQGALTNDAVAMMDMPLIWEKCLNGAGEIDLSNVPVLSRNHHLWAPQRFTSKLTGFLAGAALSSKVEPLKRDQYPSVFQHDAFKGDVFSLNELVVDVPALVRELVRDNQDAIFKIEPLNSEELKLDEAGNLISATVYMAGKSVEVAAQQFIFTAGAGNEIISHKLGEKKIAMQRRPLHMVLAKLPFEAPLYAHCMGLGSRPRVTITTHYTHDGKTVWYLGGLLAENGVKLDGRAQNAAAQNELTALFPWLDFSTAQFASFMIDRAEPLQKNGFKPETSFAKTINNIIVGWPTKLALAPKLVADVIDHLQKLKLTPQFFDLRELRSWPMPPLAKPVWEEVFCKSVA